MLNKVNQSWAVPLLIVIIAFGEFWLDSTTALGIADFIFYFLPVALSVLHHNPTTPYWTAILSTVLMIFGFYLSPKNNFESIAVINRVFATTTIWVIALMVSLIIKARKRIMDDDWLKTSVNRIANSIREDLRIDEIGQNVFHFFAEEEIGHFKVGALYIYNEDRQDLEFITGHAFVPNAEKKSIHPGEGLIGQAYLDNKQQQLNYLQNDSLKITTVFGEKNPESVLIQPLIAGKNVIGVMELGFDQVPGLLIPKLCQQFSEQVGLAILSAQNRMRLAKLLSQAQQMTEELQTQQEELRVNNEELEQQARALRESHFKLENQQAELEQTNQQLEEQSQILEGQKKILDQKHTELLKSQEELEERNREVERASQYKSEFLANMSHELRTPLNSTLILAKLLSENKAQNLTQEQVKFAEIIYSSGNDLLNLINDILDLSKVEAGKMEIKPEVIEVDSLLKHLESLFTAQAIEKKINFEIEKSKLNHETFISDRLRLEQILKNFLSNAFKFTDKGFVKLVARQGEHGIEFEVIDSGIGIPKDKQQLIFDAFKQIDGTSNRKYGGTGLGLSISKELARLLDGEIVLESELGKGSTFKIKLNQEQKSEKAISSKEELTQKASVKESSDQVVSMTFSFTDDRDRVSKRGRKILIIEDDEVFAKILYDLAHEMRFNAIVTPSAQEGMRLAKLYEPQAIILDVRLPDHSGMVVLDELKADPRTRHIPIHVMSSDDFSRSAREMGAIGFMSKPIKQDELRAAFSNFTSFMAQKKKNVLVVEDNEVQRNHIVELIADKDVHVEAVESAEEALRELSEKTYDCMIMDLSLPNMSGYDLLAKLSNENDSYSYPPVIVYTARDLTKEEEMKLRQYSGSIIIKGAKSPERLLSEVTLFLHRVETDLPPERQKMLQDLRTREKSLEERKILVVDDDIRNIFAMTSALENFGAEIVVARNGIEAIEKVKSENLDLVLMDIMMPEMDGLEAMRIIRKNNQHQNLPIIALTAKAMRDDQEKCLEAGANDYLPKPVNLDKLLTLIRVWLPQNRSFIQ